jgi:hypothetical protein
MDVKAGPQQLRSIKGANRPAADDGDFHTAKTKKAL